MAANNPRTGRLVVLATLCAGLLVGALILWQRMQPKPPPPPAATRPATSPVTVAEPPKKDAPKPPHDYLSLIQHHHPAYPATQPVDRALHPSYAGHFILDEPVHLDARRGVLFITRDDAPPTAELLAQKDIARRPVILTRERVRFVHWSQDDQGEWYMHWIVGEDASQLVNRSGRFRLQPKSDGYDWSRAFTLQDQTIVPTRHGASAFSFTPGKTPVELPAPPLAEKDPHAPVQLHLDLRGVLAWIPPAGAHPGSAGAARFVDGAWQRLSGETWPAGILQIIPLGDGNALQLLAAMENEVRLALVPLDPVKVDEAKVRRLILNLSADNPADRDKAFAELAGIGPGIWPIAEEMMKDEPPETQNRLKILMQSKVEPLLGGMKLLGRSLRVVVRTQDGMLPDHAPLLLALDGISVPRGEEDPLVLKPGWVHIRRGPVFHRLTIDMTADLDPDKFAISGWNDEWIVRDEGHGTRRWFANSFYRVLRKSEARFTRFAGIDAAGRLVFHESGGSATRPTTGATLLIDPNFPDPTPRLPVWELRGKAVGWTDDDWPVLETESSKGAFGTREWRGIDNAAYRKTRADVPAVEPFTRPATRPASGPATQAADELADFLTEADLQRPLLRDTDGNTYFDGRESLKIVRKDGTFDRLPLTGVQRGGDDYAPALIRTRNGRFFLFNQPGRVLRLRATPDEAAPFAVEATFAHRIPNVPPTRIWLDPFNRIIIAHGDNALALLFPDGYIPTETLALIPPGDLDEAEEKE